MLANPPAQKRLTAHRSEYSVRYNQAIIERSKDYAAHRFNMHYYICKACSGVVQIPVPIQNEDTQIQVSCYDTETQTRNKSTIQLDQLQTIRDFARKFNQTIDVSQMEAIKNKTNPTIWSQLLTTISKINKTT